jgi:uncharacterized membrane protein/protein-disulfide isomerase
MAMERRLTVVRCLAVAGLTVCAGLLVETPGGGVCERTGGCGDVLKSAWARPLGVPLPAVGLALFAGLLWLSLVPGTWPARLLGGLALLGGLGGLGLVLVQGLVLDRFCPFCLVVDSLAMAAALLLARAALGRQALPRCGQVVTLLWLAGGLLGAAAGAGTPLVYAQVADAPPPELLALRHPSRVTIVEIGDLHCRHCKVTHGILNRLDEMLGDRVHRVCIVVPAAEDDEGRSTAQAVRCARRQGRERAMIDNLFADPESAGKGCRGLARQLGLSLPAFEACLADPAVVQEVDHELAWAEAASRRGLPSVWVDNRLFAGVHGLGKMHEAILTAERLRKGGASR